LILVQLRKQNVELKRRSQQLLEKMQVVDINIDEVDVVSDSSADEDVTQTLNKKILCNYQYCFVIELPLYMCSIYLHEVIYNTYGSPTVDVLRPVNDI